MFHDLENKLHMFAEENKRLSAIIVEKDNDI